jgi:RNA polymerase primary sigma factor
MIVGTDGLVRQERESGKIQKPGPTKNLPAPGARKRRQVNPDRVAETNSAIPEVDEETEKKSEDPIAATPEIKAVKSADTGKSEEEGPTPADLALLEQESVTVPRKVAAPAAEERTRYDGESAIRLYLREIGKVTLLTIQEEIDLAALIQAGDEAARERMIKANLRLVVKIAHDYDWLGLPLLDLINEGNIGLMKAVEKFDPAKGGKLSTYAAWWIKQGIKRALANQSKTIRLPVHLVDKISKMRRVSLALLEQLGREPTDEEIGEEMQLPTARVSQMRTAAIRPASLDAPIGDDSDSNSFGEVIEDQNAEDPYEMLEEKTIVNMLQDLVKTLPDREATILNFRFGLDGGNEKTLEEVGHKFGVTRERVRQIQNIALNKLRKKIEKIERLET